MQNGMTRRTVVQSAAVIGLVAAVQSLAPATALAAPTKQAKKLPASANGWTLEKEANHVSTVWTRPVAGPGLRVDIRIGDAEAILVHVIRRFHYEIEQLSDVDLAGWREIGDLRKNRPESNLASGTAVQIRPGASAKGGLFPLQEMTLRDILADCEGVVRWGGDDSPVDESLFYIDAGPDDARVGAVAQKLRDWNGTPGAGAGVIMDPKGVKRRDAAEKLA
ncbi:hypothetical protein ACFWM7_10915, partial [Streptomyces sp. NPDC058375]|uniref:hypothetical protein n=1 Tax=Streptomyces sp. NPDC058375 TaxID=3346467 RepID=UPI003651B292